ncbi:hypothetical protein CDAR_120871 [Caerostris darwini]|uniref:Uncharacterized protein n=1 Tax=Caerostris darwini TaxID=1538125 RepID=A0AAV4Q7S6_9ARAC|nr:hypothetical protein CDAR_120871 [Caerostris darwini]
MDKFTLSEKATPSNSVKQESQEGSGGNYEEEARDDFRNNPIVLGVHHISSFLRLETVPICTLTTKLSNGLARKELTCCKRTFPNEKMNS